MIIEKLKLKDFRNYESLELTPHPGVNLLFGQNGSGKTNLLEAVHYCALGRSHRTSQDKEVVRKGAQMAACGVTVLRKDGRHDTAVKLTPGEGKKKSVFLDGKKAGRISEMMGRLQCVIFSPEDLMLVKDGPSARRRFLDMMLSQVSTSYFLALQQYQKAMEQRNALLREAKRGARIDSAMLDAFELAMAQPCETIIPARKEILTKINAISTHKYTHISGRPHEQFAMTYDCCLPEMTDITQRMITSLRQTRTEDMYRGSSSIGVHREDIALTLMERDMKLFASQGQIRTAALSMKLAQMDIFKQISGETPVLLLDDVMSELDMTRRTRLLDEIDGAQTFVTCTDATDLEDALNKRSYQVQMHTSGIAGITALSEGETFAMPAEEEEPDFT